MFILDNYFLCTLRSCYSQQLAVNLVFTELFPLLFLLIRTSFSHKSNLPLILTRTFFHLNFNVLLCHIFLGISIYCNKEIIKDKRLLIYLGEAWLSVFQIHLCLGVAWLSTFLTHLCLCDAWLSAFQTYIYYLPDICRRHICLILFFTPANK